MTASALLGSQVDVKGRSEEALQSAIHVFGTNCRTVIGPPSRRKKGIDAHLASWYSRPYLTRWHGRQYDRIGSNDGSSAYDERLAVLEQDLGTCTDDDVVLDDDPANPLDREVVLRQLLHRQIFVGEAEGDALKNLDAVPDDGALAQNHADTAVGKVEVVTYCDRRGNFHPKDLEACVGQLPQRAPPHHPYKPLLRRRVARVGDLAMGPGHGLGRSVSTCRPSHSPHSNPHLAVDRPL